MSAFIVSDITVNALVRWWLVNARPYTAMYHWNPARIPGGGSSIQVTHETAAEAARELMAENCRSVAHRYSHIPEQVEDCRASIEGFVYEEPASAEQLPPVVVLKVLACLEYQSCEHDEWEASRAYAICRSIEATAIRRLPGYEAAPWGLEDAAQLRQLVQPHAPTA